MTKLLTLALTALLTGAALQPIITHADPFVAECPGYTLTFVNGRLRSDAPDKHRTYPIIKIDRQDRQTVVTGRTPYGKITATFAQDGRDSVVWTNRTDVVVNQCTTAADEWQEGREAAPQTQPVICTDKIGEGVGIVAKGVLACNTAWENRPAVFGAYLKIEQCKTNIEFLRGADRGGRYIENNLEQSPCLQSTRANLGRG
jgi:hypothetical protein